MDKVLKGVGTILTGPVGLGLLGSSIFKSATSKAASPTPAPSTPVMPLADDAKLKLEARRKAAARLQGGRASTILSSNSDTLGG